MKQRLHANLAPIDLLTREELDASLNSRIDAVIRERYRGVDAARFPVVTVEGNGGTVPIGAGLGTSDSLVGPEQGDIWMVRRVNIISSSFANDAAKYLLFRGSTPSDYPGQYTNRQLLDGITFTAGTSYSTMGTPAVPASGVAVQNNTTQPYEVTISGGTVTTVTVNGFAVGSGDGTYAVPSYGSIAVTYSVAPTWGWASTLISTTGQLGANVGVAYNAASKSLLLQPGENIYGLIYNTTAGNVYLMSGEAIRVPAEMKGKLLA